MTFQPGGQARPLASEQVILAAPTSFSGVTRRLWRFWQPLAVEAQGWRKTGLWILLWLMLVLACLGVLAWYCLWVAVPLIGIPAVIVRITRRELRRGRRSSLRHGELMSRLDALPPGDAGE